MKVPFFYLTKSSQVTKLRTKKIARTNKTGNLSSSSSMSSTTYEIEKPSPAIKSSGIVRRVSITSSNAKIQCNQFTSIHFNGHDQSHKFLLHNLSSLPKKLWFKINEETMKITRASNTSTLSENHLLPPKS